MGNVKSKKSGDDEGTNDHLGEKDKCSKNAHKAETMTVEGLMKEVEAKERLLQAFINSPDITKLKTRKEREEWAKRHLK